MDWIDKRILDIEKHLKSLRVEWLKADTDRRQEIETEASRKKTELRVLQRVVNRRKRN